MEANRTPPLPIAQLAWRARTRCSEYDRGNPCCSVMFLSLDRIFLATLGKLFLTLTFTLLSFVVVIVRFPKPYNNLNH
jgi:hypothetical protein